MEITVNLIPPHRRTEIIERSRFKAVMGILFSLSFVLVCFFAMLFCFLYIIKIGDASYQKNEKRNGEDSLIEKHDKEFLETNKNINEIKLLAKDQLYWSNFFLKFSDKVPPEVVLNSLTNENYKVTIRGISQNRDNLILFKENLEKEDCFEDVKLPLSDLANKEKIDFQIDFLVKEDCLKQ